MDTFTAQLLALIIASGTVGLLCGGLLSEAFESRIVEEMEDDIER